MGVIDFVRKAFNRSPIPAQKAAPAYMEDIASHYSTGSPPPNLSDYRYAYDISPWVFACVNTRSKDAAKTPRHLFWGEVVKNDDGSERLSKKEIHDYPLVRLLKRPNPFQTGFDLVEGTCVSLDLTGKAYWVKERNRLGVPAELWLPDPSRVMPIPDRKKFIAGYRVFTSDYGGDYVDYPVEDVIYFRYYNPLDELLGHPTIKTLDLTLSLENYQLKYRKKFFEQGGSLGDIVEVDRELSTTAYMRFWAQLKARFSGLANAHVPWLLEAGAKMKQRQNSMKDAEFVEGANQVRDIVCATYNMPLTKLGVSAGSNFGNAAELDRTYKEESLEPLLLRIQEGVQNGLVPDFDDRLIFEFENVVPQNDGEKAKARNLNLISGYSTINEERAKEGKDPVAWGDEPWFPYTSSGGKPGSGGGGDGGSNGEQPTDGEPDQDSDKPKPPAEPQMRSLSLEEAKTHAKRLEIALKKRFQAQQDEVNQKVKSRGEDATADLLLFDAHKERQETEELVRDTVVAVLTILEALQASGPFIRSRPEISGGFITDTTVRQLRSTLNEGLTAKENTAQLLDRVSAVFAKAKGERAAQTGDNEISAAQNAADYYRALNAGGLWTKTWEAQLDERVRDTHRQANGQTQLLVTPFYVAGEYLMFPGDVSLGATPNNTISCRCGMKLQKEA